MGSTTQSPTDESFATTTEDYADALRKGDEVEFEYTSIEGNGDAGRRRRGMGVVVKTAPNKIVVLVPEASDYSALRVFRTDHYGAQTGGVKTNHRAGNGRTKKVGEGGKMRRTGRRVDVEYKRSGYRVADE